MLFCKHNWVKVKETYAPSLIEQGSQRIGKTDACRESIMLLMGVTTILWECSICKKIRKEEMLGKTKEEEIR